MKKLNLLLSVATLLSISNLTSCDLDTYKVDDCVVTMSLNPEVSFVVNDENVVVSVYGENDEGKMIIEGENIIGKTLDEAIELVLKIEEQTGYLVSGNAKEGDNNLEFEISIEDKDIQADMEEHIKKKVDEVCDTLDVNEIVTYDDEDKEDFREYVASINPELTEDELAALTYDDMINQVKFVY